LLSPLSKINPLLIVYYRNIYPTPLQIKKQDLD
jgi:hypothetical protein